MSRIHGTAVRATLALAAAAALVAGCQPVDADGDAAAPRSPSTSASPTSNAANTTEVCAASTKIIIDGSRRIADESVAAIDGRLSEAERGRQLKANFATMSGALREQAARATDPALRTVIERAAADLDAGAKAADPTAFMSTDFVKVATTIDEKCGN